MSAYNVTMGQRALDLFAGVGWGVACQRLGIEELGIEKMPEANASRAAAGMHTVAEDVWEVDPADFIGQIDGLIASPPCQTFSAAGKGKGREALDQVLEAIETNSYKDMESLRALGVTVGDERTALVLTPLHYWHIIRPQWVAFEQVPTVLPVWEACAEVMREAGYSVWTGNLQAEMYGVPQTRKRAFLIAHRDLEVAPPAPTHSRYYSRKPERLEEGVAKWVSMAEALGWGLEQRPSPTITGGGTETGGAEPIAKLARYTGREDWILRNNNTANAAERGLDEPAPTLYFGQRERPPSEPSATITGKGTAYWQGGLRELPDWAFRRPSTTIVGTFKPEIVAAPGYRTTISRQNAPDSVRVTVQEAGVLQSFAPDFPWQGSKSKQYLQVGNAVPPLLAEAVLRSVVK